MRAITTRVAVIIVHHKDGIGRGGDRHICCGLGGILFGNPRMHIGGGASIRSVEKRCFQVRGGQISDPHIAVKAEGHEIPVG